MLTQTFLFFQQYPLYFYTTLGLLGAIIGSFLNVVIIRLPIMLEHGWQAQCQELLGIKNAKKQPSYNLIIPRSQCPNCNKPIQALDNIPILSFILLGGKCRQCKQKISSVYPAIEIVSTIMAIAVAVYFGPNLQMLASLILCWSLLVLCMIDLKHFLLPDDITLPLLWLGILSNTVMLFTDIYSSVFGAIAGYLILWSVWCLFKLATGKDGMGHGDFKLLAALGAWFGWQALPTLIILSATIGTIIGLYLILFKTHDKNIPIPFGPYLAIAGWITLFISSNEKYSIFLAIS